MALSYISANDLLADSYALAIKIAESGFRPDLLIALWRGGTPVGLAVQEVFEFLDLSCEHFALRTTSYRNPGEQQQTIQLWGMEQLEASLPYCSNLLLVDDVFDSGRTAQHVINALRASPSPPQRTIRIATPWYKPASNVTNLTPDYYLHETRDWLVFPHELYGLEPEQILHKPGVHALAQRLLQLRDALRDR
jgi:hypoxanthine phosphoribosyltransferase